MKADFAPAQMVRISQIHRSTQSSAWTIDPKVVERIKASMQEVGQCAPIIVSKLGEDDYQLVDGRHRLEAAESAEQSEIWACILSRDGVEAELVGLSSNLHRRRLSDPEFEIALKRLKQLQEQRRDVGGPAPLVTKRVIADMAGTNTTDVKRTRALEKLSPNCRADFEAGEINKGAAYELTKLPQEAQDRLLPKARLVKQKKLTRDAFRHLVSTERGAPTGANSRAKSTIRELPGARWHRLIDTVKDVSDDELRKLPTEEAASLHKAACDLMEKAHLMKDRLDRLRVTLPMASGAKS